MPVSMPRSKGDERTWQLRQVPCRARVRSAASVRQIVCQVAAVADAGAAKAPRRGLPPAACPAVAEPCEACGALVGTPVGPCGGGEQPPAGARGAGRIRSDKVECPCARTGDARALPQHPGLGPWGHWLAVEQTLLSRGTERSGPSLARFPPAVWRLREPIARKGRRSLTARGGCLGGALLASADVCSACAVALLEKLVCACWCA